MKQTYTKIIVVTKLPDENTGVPTSSTDCSRNYSLALKTGSIVDGNYRMAIETNAWATAVAELCVCDTLNRV
jgi:hypothetical protein